MTSSIAITLGAIALLLILSGFFSGSETALTAASRARMHQLALNGDKRANLVNQLFAMRDRLISALLLGNNLVNILASALATSLLIRLTGEAGVAYATLIMTLLVLIFSEVLPKTYAIRHPDEAALAAAPVIRLFVILLSPFASVVQALVYLILRMCGAADANRTSLLSAHDELRGAIDLHHREGSVVKDDRDMLGGILDLKELAVSDVMVHRTNMATVDIDASLQKTIPELLSSAHTRTPVWRNSPDNIIGVLHAKDLARALVDTPGGIEKINLNKIMSDPWFVPEGTSLQDQLRAFLQRNSHFALVVDEYGEVMGLVTLEDILEEIVGDIADEHDTKIEGVVPRADGSLIVDGAVPVRDLNRAFEWNLPDDEATTIAGLVIHAAQTIPDKGQAFTFYGMRFEVLRRQRNRITQLNIHPQRAARTD